MKRALLVLLLAPSLAVADDQSEAQALFDRGIAEMKDGKIDEACKLLAASLAKLPDSGTRGALALCTTKQGKIATAWALWKELAVTAPTDAMKTAAADEAAKLEPRLPRYQIKSKPATAGLIVKVNGSVVDTTIEVPLPVDPGKVMITASAPDHQEWTGEVTATEGQVTPIEVPALVPTPKQTTELIAPVPVIETKPKRNWLAIGLVAGGGAAIITGAIFGLRASSLGNDAETLCGDLDSCPGDRFADATAKYDSARTSATISTVLVTAGLAAAAGGAVLWYVQRGKPADRTAVVPAVTRDGAGVVLTGSWR